MPIKCATVYFSNSPYAVYSNTWMLYVKKSELETVCTKKVYKTEKKFCHWWDSNKVNRPLALVMSIEFLPKTYCNLFLK